MAITANVVFFLFFFFSKTFCGLGRLSSDSGQTFVSMLRLGTNGTIDSNEEGGGGAIGGAELAE
jgi:hypothetical protein